MITSTTLPHSLETAFAAWAERAGCRLLMLFGSAAAGTARPRSDLDLAVLLRPLPDAGDRLSMIGQLQDLCGQRRADVTFLTPGTNPVFHFEVFRAGRPLFEAEPGVFAAEVVRALACYEDALPFRRRLAEQLAGQAKR